MFGTDEEEDRRRSDFKFDTVKIDRLEDQFVASPVRGSEDSMSHLVTFIPDLERLNVFL